MSLMMYRLESLFYVWDSLACDPTMRKAGSIMLLIGQLLHIARSNPHFWHRIATDYWRSNNFPETTTCNMDRVEKIIIKGSIQLMFKNGKSPSCQHATDEARQTPTGHDAPPNPKRQRILLPEALETIVQLTQESQKHWSTESKHNRPF